MGHVLVFGSFVVDLMSRAPHLPVPGETVKGSMFKLGPGGKGFNQGVAAKKSGADMTMVTKIGRDTFGKVALDVMHDLHIDTRGIFYSEDRETGCALIMVDENTSQNAILVVSGACGTFTNDDIAAIEPMIANASILLTQLEVNMDATEAVVAMAHRYGVKTILNTAPVQPVSDEMLQCVSMITPNEVEAEILTGIPIDSETNALRAADYFFKKGVGKVIITLGGRGVFVAAGSEHAIIPAFSVDVLDTTGAGDAFNGGLATALSEGKDIFKACRFANAVAALSVTRIGTALSMPTRKEIDEFLAIHR